MSRYDLIMERPISPKTDKIWNNGQILGDNVVERDETVEGPPLRRPTTFRMRIPEGTRGRLLLITAVNASEADLVNLRTQVEIALSDPSHVILTNFAIELQEIRLGDAESA